MRDLAIDSLRITYGGVDAVKGFSLDIEAGQLVSLLGPSGSGKTSVLRAIGGYLKPAAGAIRIGGRDITDVPPQFRDMGMVFQSFLLFPHMSVLDNVEFGLRTRGIAREERRRRATEALAMVQMEKFLHRLPFELSGGQQQRVALARAIVIRPTVLLMDEPMGALDAKLRAQAQEEIRAVQQEVGVTTILVTHDQQEAMAMSDRIVVMRDGEIMDDGEPGRLYWKPRNAFTADFLGGTTLVPVQVLEAAGAGTRVRVTASGHEFLAHGDRPGKETAAFVSLRPEVIRCSREPVSGGIAGRVVKRTFYGLNTFLRVQTAELGPLVALENAGQGLRDGTEVCVSWLPEDGRLLQGAV